MNIDVKLTLEQIELLLAVLGNIHLSPELQTIYNRLEVYKKALLLLKKQRAI